MGTVSLQPREAVRLLLAGLLACGAPSEPSSSSVQVSVLVSGEGADPDGFRLTVDGRASQVVPPGGSATFALTSGQHTIQLTGVAPNCDIDGDQTRSFSVSAGETATVSFDVSCLAASGSLEVVASTAGPDGNLDPSGYVVMLDGVPRIVVAANGSVTLAVSIGFHQVTLGDLARNCELAAGPGPANVASGATIRVTFALTCTEVPPAGRGQEIAFIRDEGTDPATLIEHSAVVVMNADGTAARKVLNADLTSAQYVAWAPDGSALAFVGSTLGFDTHLYTLDALTNEWRILTSASCFAPITWSPDGARIGCETRSEVDDEEGNFLFYRLDVMSVGVDDSEPVIHASLTDPDFSSADRVAWSPDGTTLAFGVSRLFFEDPTDPLNLPGQSSDIYLVDFDGSNLRQLTSTFEPEFEPAWSPDGTRIAFTAWPGPLQGAPDIYVMNADGTGTTRLTTGGDSFSPTWSPDGNRIAFVSGRDGNAEIYVMNADGTDQTRITNYPLSDEGPSWRP